MSKIFNDTIIYVVRGLGCYGLDPTLKAQYIEQIRRVSHVPVENIKYKCHKNSSGIKCILKTYFKAMPLKESRFVHNLVDEITADISDSRYNNVFVFGDSFGGAIVNRVAEILNTNYKKQKSDLKVDEKYIKLSMVGFGSIYIPSYESIKNINIINYLSNSDVAMKCNKIRPIPLEDMRLQLRWPFSFSSIVCKMPVSQESFEKTKIIQICLYNLESGQPLCRTDGPSITEWEEHNTYDLIKYSIFFIFIRAKNTDMTNLQNLTNIYNLKDFIIEEPGIAEKPAIPEKSSNKTKKRKSGSKSGSPRSSRRSSPKSSPRSSPKSSPKNMVAPKAVEPSENNHIRYPNGDYYVGNITSDNKKHGKGVMQYHNGRFYEGEWLDDSMHGKGKYIDVQGKVFEGFFNRGLFKKP